MTILLTFTSSVFLAAFLLFQVQPLISRYILPWFGGVPAVWSAALLFFQSMLLAGYAYAHWLTSKSRRWIWFHCGLISLSIVLMGIAIYQWGSPLLPGETLKPQDSQQPIAHILVILLISVGLPYFLLSSTSPIYQSWFSRLKPGRSAYQLYAISNFGSLLGLLSYPFIFEPIMRLKTQSWIWGAGYLIFSSLSFYLARKMLSTPRFGTEDPLKPKVSARQQNLKLKFLQPILWVSLSACASMLLLSVTNQLTQDIAVIPFLWVLPLSIYLLSFILAFAGKNFYPRLPVILLLAICTFSLGFRLNLLTGTNIVIQILVFTLFLFLGTLSCLGELYQLRPDPKKLTSFYLLIAFGGMIGGLFVNILAPKIFQDYWELHISILFTWLLIVLMQWIVRPSIFDHRWGRELIPMLIVFLVLSGYLLIRQVRVSMIDVVDIQRNFFGVLRVEEMELGQPPASAYKIKHGSTSHGLQFIEEEKRDIPTAYYSRQSGAGQVLTTFKPDTNQHENKKVGLIGLGIGTLAAYGKPGDTFRFYEINPGMIDLALGNGKYFSYLKDSPATIEIVTGDARISLERELQTMDSHQFDILLVDAFNSDSIPIHLLTLEAFELYQQHLKPNGVLGIHISNRYINLETLIVKIAGQLDLEYALIQSYRDDQIGSSDAKWMLLSNDESFFQNLNHDQTIRLTPINLQDFKIWTDDYHNLLPLVKENLFENMQPAPAD
jgi:hypothetical protein